MSLNISLEHYLITIKIILKERVAKDSEMDLNKVNQALNIYEGSLLETINDKENHTTVDLEVNVEHLSEEKAV